MFTKYEQLKALLETPIEASQTAYHAVYVDEHCIVFAETEGTNKVMIPTDVAIEWIQAYEFGLIKLDMKARAMKDVVKQRSSWARFQHGFDSHLRAIVKNWAERYPYSSDA